MFETNRIGQRITMNANVTHVNVELKRKERFQRGGLFGALLMQNGPELTSKYFGDGRLAYFRLKMEWNQPSVQNFNLYLYASC